MTTEVPNLTQGDLLQRLIQDWPRPWSSDDSKTPPGVVASVLDSIFASPHGVVTPGIYYIFLAVRIKTAINGALDVISTDLFGTALPRLTMESDADFRTRILDELLEPRVTRAAIQTEAAESSGSPAIMTEPWNPSDTMSWDTQCFWDVDLPPTFPCRWGDDGLYYQGMVSLESPVFSVTGGQPVYAYDLGMAWDIGTAAWFDLNATQSLQFTDIMDAILNTFKAEGTILWRKYFFRGATQALMTLSFPAGSFLVNFTNPNLQFFYLNMLNEAGRFVLVGEVPPWMTNIWLVQPGVDFSMGVSSAAPTGGATVGVYGLPLTTPGVLTVPVNEFQTALQVLPPGGVGSKIPIIFPTWNTIVWLASIADPILNVNVATGGPGDLHVILFPATQGGITPVLPGSRSITIPLPAGITQPYAVFATLGWNTQRALLSKTATDFTIQFAAPPVGSQVLYWAVVPGVS